MPWLSTREIVVEIATASITGRVRVKSPVISTTLASAVSGPRAAEANTEPMPTTA